MLRRDSSVPEARTAPPTRAHVYCLLSLPRFRYLGFIFILGALAAFVLFDLLCSPLSSSSYCNSTPGILTKFLALPSTENSSEQNSCVTEGNCITTADSAVVLGFHLRHIHFMVDLVEGTGLPPGDYFDFRGSLFIDTGRYSVFSDAELDKDRKVFVDNLYTLCKFRYPIQLHYHDYLINKFFKSFRPWGASPVLNPFEAAIKNLNRAAEQEVLMEAASLRLRKKYAIKVDNILRPSLDRFFADIHDAFSKLAAGIPPMLQLFANCSSYGHLVSEGLNAEIPRVEEAYRNLPWWESVPILDLVIESILGIKPRRWAISSYKEFLSKDEASIRTLVEHASIFHDHFATLARYFVWYANHPVTYRYNGTEKPLTADELAHSVADARARLDHDYYGDNLDIPPRRVIGSRLSLPFNKDSLVDESIVDLDP